MLKVLLTIGFVQSLTILVMLARTKALALLLGPEWIGVMAVVDRLLAVLSQTALLSLPFAAVRFLPPLWSQSPDQFASVVRRMRNLLLVTMLVITLLSGLVTAWFPQLWGRDLLPHRSVVFFGLLSLPVLVFVPFLQNAIAGRLQHKQAMAFGLVHAGVFTLAAILGVWWNGLDGLYALYAVFGLLLVIPVTRIVGRIPVPAVGVAPMDWRFSINLPRPIWRFSLSFLGLSFIIPFVALYVYYQVLHIFGAATAGWMQAAMGLGFAMRSVLGTAHGAFLTPHVNRGGSPAERMRLAGEFQKTFSFLCVLAIPPLVLFPHIALALLYSTEFLGAAPFVFLFVLTEVLTLLAGTYNALVIAFDHLAFHIIQSLIAQCLLLVVVTLLIEPYGILGAGVAGIIAQLFIYSGTLLFLKRSYGLKVPLRRACLTVFVVVSIAISGIIGITHPELSLPIVAGKLSIYGVLVAGLALFLDPEDWANIGHTARNIRARCRLVRGAR